MNEISVTKKADYEVLAWAKYITFTHKDKEYSVKLYWDEFDGYQITKGWDELPNELKDQDGELCSKLDEITYLLEKGENA